MSNCLLKKGLVIGIIILFIGVSFVPNISGNVKKTTKIEDVYNEIYDEILSTDTTSINTHRLENPFFDTYEIIEFGQAAWGLSDADFNDDGFIDFAVSSATVPFSNSTISILYHDGDLGFTQDDVYSFNYSYISDLDSGDYDNDGDIDLMFTYSENVYYQGYYVKINGVVNMLFNDGMNNFGNRTEVAWHGPGTPYDDENRINPQLSSADYDMDGDIDFLVGDNSGKIEFYRNNGSGDFTSAGIIHDFGHCSWGVTSADYDNDGDIDFLVAAEYSEFLGHVYLKHNQMVESNFTLCFEPGSGEIINDISNDPGTACLTSIDYNNDGAMDYVAGMWRVPYLFMNKQGFFNRFPICGLPPFSGYVDSLNGGALTVADYNDDGFDDLVVGGVQGVVRLFINKHCLAVITRPEERYWYKFDEKQYPIYSNEGVLVIGRITIGVKELEDIERVEFYVNRLRRHIDTTPPYNFTWRFGNPFRHNHTIKIVAYNSDGSYSSEDEIKIRRFL